MKLIDEGWRGLIGSVRLVWRDEGLDHWFNLESNGFWRSFAAIIPVAPMFVYPVTLDPSPDPQTTMPSIAMALVILAVQWVLWPLVMVPVAQMLKLSSNYARYITIYNWSTLLVVAALAVPMFMYDFGLVSGSAALSSQSLILIAVLVYRWITAVEALKCNGFIAVGLVAADLATSLLVNQFLL